MSLTQEPAPEQGATTTPQATSHEYLRRRLWRVCFALLAFEVGAFLAIFPWIDAWTLNHLPSLFPSVLGGFQDLWDEPFFKGAVSSLGVLNLYIALRQAISLLLKNS